MNVQFIPVTKENIVEALPIYNWYVENSTATFHLAPVDVIEFTRMLSVGHAKYRSYLIFYNNKVCGFCYISQFRYKEAYNQSAEVTLYLSENATGKGIGKITLLHLEEVAKENGIVNLIGVITEENTPSIHLFEKCDYFKVGHLKKIGVKFGKALDVVSYQKII